MISATMTAGRRPIADIFRATANGGVRMCLRRSVHPDLISCSSMIAAGAAALCFALSGDHPALLWIAPLLCHLRLWLNMLDGMVAGAGGTKSRRGEIFNELPDRVSDILIFAGVAHSGLCFVLSGYWAAILSVLTAYVGTLAQAVSGRREFGGTMSKPWRMAALHAGAWMTIAMPAARVAGLTVLDWTCIAVMAGCVQTIGIRLIRTLRDQSFGGPVGS